MTLIIGNYLSPYVRKVLVALEMKGVAYTIDPITPFYGTDDFAKVSPLRRIPVLIEDAVTLCDSTVICEYIEERYPGAALLPSSPADRARARWLEEYADSRMGDVFIWRIFNQFVIRRAVWGEKPDMAVVEKALGDEVPEICTYLDGEAPADGFLFGADPGLADIAVAAMFRNLGFARQGIDVERFRVLAAWIARVHALPAFTKLAQFENLLMQTPPAQQRAALSEAGAPLSQTSFGSDAPRRGIMPLGDTT
jgi:glutathione S-transferase